MVTVAFVKTPGTTVPTLAGVGAVEVHRDANGQPCGFTFPAPFDDLQVMHGAAVTPDLLRRVAEALDYFSVRQ